MEKQQVFLIRHAMFFRQMAARVSEGRGGDDTK